MNVISNCSVSCVLNWTSPKTKNLVFQSLVEAIAIWYLMSVEMPHIPSGYIGHPGIAWCKIARPCIKWNIKTLLIHSLVSFACAVGLHSYLVCSLCWTNLVLNYPCCVWFTLICKRHCWQKWFCLVFGSSFVHVYWIFYCYCNNFAVLECVLRLLYVHHFTSVELRSSMISMSQSMCLSVCLFTRITWKQCGHTSPNSLCMLPLAWFGPLLMALRYVMYFQFYGWRHVFIPLDLWVDEHHGVMWLASTSGRWPGVGRCSTLAH